MSNPEYIPINFLKLKGLDIIKNFIDVEDLNNEFSWCKGKDNISYGGLARKNNNEYIAYILPIVYTMNYKKVSNKNIDQLVNDLSWNSDRLVWKYTDNGKGYESQYQLQDDDIMNNMNNMNGGMLDINVKNKINDLEAEASRLEKENNLIGREINNLKNSEDELTKLILKGGSRKKSNLKKKIKN